MKKLKLKPEAIVILSIVSIVLIAGIISIIPGAPLSGGAFLSIDKILIQSSNEQLGGKKAVVIQVVANRQAQHAVGEITPDDVETFTGQRSSEPFTLSVDLLSQECNYVVQETDEILYSVNLYCPSTQGPCPTCTANQVGSTRILRDWGEEICVIYKEPKWRVAKPSTITLYDYIVDVVITKESGESIKGTLTPNDISAALGDVGSVRWVGSFTGSQSCPVPSVDTVFIRPISAEHEYKAVSLSEYNTLKFVFANGFWNTPLNEWDKWNSQLDAFVSKPPYSSGDIMCEFDTTLAEPTYSCEPSQPAIFPTLQVILLADWIGLGVPNGMPQIISIGQPEVVEANLTRYPIEVKNIGDSDDTFTLTLMCQTPVVLRAPQEFIPQGETKTMNLEIEGLESSQTCSLTAKSINNPNNLDTQEFILEIVLRNCPSEFACCELGSGYKPKACEPAPYCVEYGDTPLGGGDPECIEWGVRDRYCKDFTCLFASTDTELELVNQQKSDESKYDTQPEAPIIYSDGEVSIAGDDPLIIFALLGIGAAGVVIVVAVLTKKYGS